MPLRPGSRFAEVYRRGARTHRGGVTVIRARDASSPDVGEAPSVGIVASRKVGNAVRRNRVKRRLREAVRRVPLESGTSYVVIASPAVVDVGFGELVEWLTKAVTAEAT